MLSLLAALNARAEDSIGSGTVSGTPGRVVVNPITNKYYFITASANVYEVDGTTFQALPLNIQGAGVNGFDGIAVDPSSNKVFAISTANNALVTFDRITGQGSSAMVSSPAAVAYNPLNNKVYVAYFSGGNCRVNTYTNGTLIDNLALTGTGTSTVRGLALNLKGGGRVYVLTSASGVFQINCAVGLGDTVDVPVAPVGTNPSDIAFNPIIDKVYVSNAGSNTVSILNAGGPSLPGAPGITTVATGIAPGALAINQKNNQVYVANFGESGQLGSLPLTIIDGGNMARTAASTEARSGQYSSIAINHNTNRVYLIAAQVGVEVRDGDANGAVDGYLEKLSIGRNGVAVNPVTNRLVVTDASGFAIIDSATHLRMSATVGSGAIDVAVNRATNTIYVANNGGTTVSVINGADNSVAATIDLMLSPDAIAVNESLNKIYVLHSQALGKVSIIDGTTNTFTTINVGAKPVALAVNTLTNKVYVANRDSNNVSVINSAGVETKKIAVGMKPVAVLVNSELNRIFVANYDSNTVTAIDGGTDEYAKSSNLDANGAASVGNKPVAMARSQTHRVFVVNSIGNSLTIIDGVDFSVGAETGIGTAPQSITYNSVNDSIYVGLSATDSNKVIRADAGNLNNQTEILVGQNPVKLAADPVSNRLYVACRDNNVVMVVNCKNNSVINNIPVQQQPVALAVNPVTGRVYIANNGSIDLTVLDMQDEKNVGMTPTPVLPGAPGTNRIFSSSASVSVTVAGTMATGLPARDVYYQVDGKQGRWNKAAGSAPGPWSVDLTNQTPGTHVLYVFATDGQEGSFDGGAGSGSPAGTSARVSTIGSLVYTVQNNNQPTLDPINNGQTLILNEDDLLQVIPLTGISEGNSNESAQIILSALVEIITNENSVVASAQVVYAPDSATGELRFTLMPDAFNLPNKKAVLRVTIQDNGGTQNGATDRIQRELHVVVMPVNDPPVITPFSPNPLVINEDAGLQTVMITGIDIGPANEADTDGNGMPEQMVQNPDVFTSDAGLIPNPVISDYNPQTKTAKLTFTALPNKSGTATINVRLTDNGGALNRVSNFGLIVQVTPVNDAPTIDQAADLSINEDSGAQTLNLSGISNGALEVGQTLSFAISSSNTALMPTPTITSNGNATATLSFAPVANLSGTSVITVTVTDTGASVAPNVNFKTMAFTLTVKPVNDQPSFTKGPNFTVTEASTVTTSSGWAMAFVFGPADEAASQAVKAFILTPDKPEFFAVAPAIDKLGVLTFTPGNNINAAVTVTVSVQLQDDGGTAQGGVDTSTAQTFTLSMTPLSDALVVRNTQDSGTHSLRDCMSRARSGDTITFDADIFDLTNSNAATVINVESELPAMDDGSVTLDASDRRVTVNGSGTATASGILIKSSANTVRGLNIIGFPKSGVTISGGAKSNTIGGSRSTGTGPNGQGLRISGNGAFGLEITGAGTSANVIKGCWIGLDASGTLPDPNLAGVLIQDRAAQNTLGGTGAGEANVISGNKFEGLTFSGTGTDDNTILASAVGVAGVDSVTAATRGVSSRDDDEGTIGGRASVGNGSAGVFLSRGTKGSKVGGESTTEGNVVGFNGGSGVEVRAAGSRRNAAKRNRISRNASGGIALFDNANDGIAAPTFTAVTKTATTTGASTRASSRVTITGRTGSSSGEVEVFSDSGSQGETIAGRATVSNGIWTTEVDISDLENITATFTDASGNTSPFAVYGRVSGGSGTTGDTDGDGVSDELETLAGTDLTNAAVAPKAEGAVVTDKAAVSIGFLKTGKDTIKTTMRVILPEGFVLAGSSVAIKYAGVTESFTTFDSKGFSPKGGLTSLKIAGANTTAGAATGGILTFSVKGKDLRTLLSAGGLAEKTTVKAGENVTVPVAVAITTTAGKYVYIGESKLLYKATQGKTGKASLSK